jgi:hypothetical protein
MISASQLSISCVHWKGLINWFYIDAQSAPCSEKSNQILCREINAAHYENILKIVLVEPRPLTANLSDTGVISVVYTQLQMLTLNNPPTKCSAF